MSTCSRALRSDPGDQEQARAESADDGSEGVGGVDARKSVWRHPVLSMRPRKRQGEARAPQERRRQQGPKRAGEIELEVEPDVRRDRRIDRPVRERRGQAVRGPGDRGGSEQLAPAQRQARAREDSTEQRPDAAADPKAGEKDRDDDGERVNRSAEEQAQRARPDGFGRQRAESRECDRDVDGRRLRPCRAGYRRCTERVDRSAGPQARTRSPQPPR